MAQKVTKTKIITLKEGLTKLLYTTIGHITLTPEMERLLKDTLSVLESITLYTLNFQLDEAASRLANIIEKHSKILFIDLSTNEWLITWDCIKQCKRLAAYVKYLLLAEQDALTQKQKELDEKIKYVEEAAQRVSKKIEGEFMRIKPDTELIAELNNISNSPIRMTFVNIYTLLQNVERFLQRVTYANIPTCDMIAQATSFIEQLSQVEEGDYLRFSNVIQRCIVELQKIKSISNEQVVSEYAEAAAKRVKEQVVKEAKGVWVGGTIRKFSLCQVTNEVIRKHEERLKELFEQGPHKIDTFIDMCQHIKQLRMDHLTDLIRKEILDGTE